MDFQKAFTFLSKLRRNNNKVWFDKNKDSYLELKQEFEEFVNRMIREMEKFDTGLRNLEAKHCVFRIYKDVRFSKDKTPYKTHMGAYLSKGGKKSPHAGYYFHLEPGGKSMLAGGVWMPPTEVLSSIRQEIDYNTNEFLKILKEKNFKKNFGELYEDKLVRNPKDYPADHPHIELLKYKSYTVIHEMDDKKVLDKNFLKYLTGVYKSMYPFNSFLNAAVEEANEKN